MNIKAKPSKIFCKFFNGLNHLHNIFERYSWILWMWSKSLNCFNNQKNGQENTSDWAKKKNYGNWLYLCLLGNNSAVIKRPPPKGDQKTNHAGSSVIKRTPRRAIKKPT